MSRDPSRSGARRERPRPGPGRDLGLSYRPALDGYRGIFVVLVLAYHFGVTSLSGGWIGINHFFVFSGLLIAQILIREWQRRGRIDALRFYLRRARRLLPALLVVVTAVLAHALVTSGDRRQSVGDAVATLTFWQNWRLVARDDQYFDPTTEPSPLRHLWTLGVEEQFYLVIPFAIAGLMLLRARWMRATLVLALAVASALWTAHLTGAGATVSRLYYGTDVRAQALLVGVAAALLLTPDRGGRAPRLPRGVVEAIGWIATIGSTAAFFVLGEADRWVFERGGMLLFGVLAALMAISALDPRPLLLNRLVSAAPFVHLGQISYGLYLYHWPLQVWLPLDGLPTVLAVAIKLALTWAIALVSFRYLERPVLEHGAKAVLRPLRRLRWAGPAAYAAVTALALALATVWSPAVAGPWDGRPLPGASEYTAPDGEVRVAVVGSSIAQSLAEGVETGDYPRLRVISSTRRGSCNAVPLTFRFQGGGEVGEAPVCGPWRERWPTDVRTERADVVLSPIETALTETLVVDGRDVPVGSPEHDAQIEATLDALLDQTDRAGARQLQLVNATCHDDPAEREGGRDLGAIRIDPTHVNAVATRWGQQVNEGDGPVRVAVLDLAARLCEGGYHPEINGAELYSDRIHYSRQGAELIWTWLAPQVVTAWQLRDE